MVSLMFGSNDMDTVTGNKTTFSCLSFTLARFFFFLCFFLALSFFFLFFFIYWRPRKYIWADLYSEYYKCSRSPAPFFQHSRVS